MAKHVKSVRRRMKRTIRPAEYLEPTQYELDHIIPELQRFYGNNPQFIKKKETIDTKIDKVLDECKKGWICASKDFIKRVEFKTKMRSSAIKQLPSYKPNYVTERAIKLSGEVREDKKFLYPGISGKDMRSSLSDPKERKFWQEREEYYREEFEFNNSSDWTLLQQLLLEELLQRRFTIKAMKEPDNQELTLLMSESYKRLIQAQKSLGITRDQREGAMKETDGNVGQLSLKYEEKLKLIDRIERKRELEEESFLSHHDDLEYLESAKKLPGMRDDLGDELKTYKESENKEIFGNEDLNG